MTATNKLIIYQGENDFVSKKNINFGYCILSGFPSLPCINYRSLISAYQKCTQHVKAEEIEDSDAGAAGILLSRAVV